MGWFRKKRVERPKNPLGAALYDYDHTWGAIKKITANVQAGKPVKVDRVKKLLIQNKAKLNQILKDISKENLKVDYRSDKIRYKISDMVIQLIDFLDMGQKHNFDDQFVDASRLDNLMDRRESLKKDMKDIESDYL
ncbi:MAG: hypothetical protein PHN32_01730 [Actinomycetota bacterium]|nr:hypothetical protein [Actinomycetota bacterium]